MGTALVLSAGGLYAAWEVGVWKALHALPGVQPDIVVGASAGALNGWAIAGGCTVQELEREWLEPRMAGIMQPGLHRSGVLRPAALYPLMKHVLGPGGSTAVDRVTDRAIAAYRRRRFDYRYNR